VRKEPQLLVRCLPSVAIAAALFCFGSACSNQHSSNEADGQSSESAQTTDQSQNAKSQSCEQLSVADVQPFYKSPVAKTTVDQNSVVQGTSECFFKTTPQGSSLQIITTSSAALIAQDAMTAKHDGKPGVPLPGIGDKAIRQADDVWVFATQGGVFCAVQGNHAADSAQNAAALELRGLKTSDVRSGKIPDATAQALAEQLGTLCNKIFGSGNMTPSFAGLN
jgi:hypothetical protein